METVLTGIRILDLTRYFPGPFATLRLQEQGAEIIKVEDKNGDPARYMDSYMGEEGCIFRSMSRGKKCVSLNMKDAEDLAQFKELVSGVDALIESFRPGVTKRLGIDFESLIKINPRLVYVSLSGYGQNTSLANLAGHDLNYLAYSGVLDQLLDEGNKPIKPQIAFADLIAGLAASEAVSMGLLKSFRSGEGVYVDLAMTDAVLSFMGLHVTYHSATGMEHGINEHGIGYGIFRTSDNRYVALCALEEKFFTNFCKAVGKEHLIEYQHSPLDDSNPAFREIKETIAEKPIEYWTEFALRVDCCMAPVLKTSELKNSVYVRERGFIESRWGLDYVATHFAGEGKGFLNYEKAFSKLGEDNHLFLNKKINNI